MSLELVHGVEGVVNPDTGEVLELWTATLDELVAAREALNVLYEQRNVAASMIDAELVRRADQRVASGEATSYSFDAANSHVAVATGSARTYDADGLRAELLEMHERGALDAPTQANSIGLRAIDEAFTARYYVRLRQLGNLLRLQPDVIGPIVERFSSPKRRSVRLEPLPAHRQTIEATAEVEASGPTETFGEIVAAQDYGVTSFRRRDAARSRQRRERRRRRLLRRRPQPAPSAADRRARARPDRRLADRRDARRRIRRPRRRRYPASVAGDRAARRTAGGLGGVEALGAPPRPARRSG